MPTTIDASFTDSLPANVAVQFLERVAKSPQREAFRYPVGEDWKSITWKQAGDDVSKIAAGLLALGVQAEWARERAWSGRQRERPCQQSAGRGKLGQAGERAYAVGRERGDDGDGRDGHRVEAEQLAGDELADGRGLGGPGDGRAGEGDRRACGRG